MQTLTQHPLAIKKPPHQVGGPSAAQKTRFGGKAMGKVVDWVAENIYERGEGFRYASEQTLLFTVPRTTQQFFRTFSHTGEGNTLAAAETITRDLGADFTDTFLPGLLATLLIGPALDKWFKATDGDRTFVRFNMGEKALNFYSNVASNGEKFGTRSEFLKRMEKVLIDYSSEKNVTLELEKLLNEAKYAGRINGPDVEKAAETVAKKLKLTNYDLKLKNSAKDATKSLSITLDDLLRDLWHINDRSTKGAATKEWGKTLSEKLMKTLSRSRWQILATCTALAGSLFIPFGIRLMTRHFYKVDKFPGAEELRRHYVGEEEAKKPSKFELFPYINKTQKEGNYLPTALSAGFFALLAGLVVKNRFIGKLSEMGGIKNLLKPSKWKNDIRKWQAWARVYEFDRGFPWTSWTQMELTFGILCGMRLLASREESEFREAFIQDAMFGWPTLTYLFPVLKTTMAKSMKGLASQKELLIKPNGSLRSTSEITEPILKNLMEKAGKETQNIASLTQKTRNLQRGITVGAGALSALLLVLQPQAVIMLTNWLETRKIFAEHRKRADETLLFASRQPLQHSQNGLFNNFRNHHNQYMSPTTAW